MTEKELTLPNGHPRYYMVTCNRVGYFKWVWTAWLTNSEKVTVQCDYPWNIKRELIKSWRVYISANTKS